VSNDGERIARLWAEYHPRIEEAKTRAAEASSVCFVDLHEEKILDFPAVVLTLERYLLLEQAGVFDGTCGEDANSVLLFLWIVNPDFVPEPRPGKKFFRKHRKLDFVTYAVAIERYMKKMFPESGSGDEGGGESSGRSWVASMIDLIASEYAWKESEIFRIPIPRLLQYAKTIRRRMGGDSVDFCPEADRLKAEFMREANELRKEGS
tara:strand:- start:239 stop:859 length:621 start_codon:yes stop_codon:yes gene_type:complete